MSKYNRTETGEYFFAREYNFADKTRCANNHILYMLNRTQELFKYDGLPETIPQNMLELYLQTNGHVCITKVNDEVYAFVGGWGGEPDIYYRPTRYIVANPVLKESLNLTVNEDCIIIPNDSLYVGLLPLFNKYAWALVENELSLDIATKNARIIDLISASDDRTKESALQYLKQVDDGKRGIIMETALLDGIKAQPYGTTGATQTIQNLIEYEQYLRAGWFNELGLQANYNMKRESINSNESQLNDDMLQPLIDNMLAKRKEYIEKVNEMFDLNISVSLNSAWEDNEKEREFELENIDAEDNKIVDQTGEEGEDDDNQETE